MCQAFADQDIADVAAVDGDSAAHPAVIGAARALGAGAAGAADAGQRGVAARDQVLQPR
jgi:hypothetical protein